MVARQHFGLAQPQLLQVQRRALRFDARLGGTHGGQDLVRLLEWHQWQAVRHLSAHPFWRTDRSRAQARPASVRRAENSIQGRAH